MVHVISYSCTRKVHRKFKGVKKLLTKEQEEILEYQYNYYSFRKEFNEKVGDMEESKINLAKMRALKAVFDALGYKTPWEKYDEKCGVKYDYYKLVKEC